MTIKRVYQGKSSRTNKMIWWSDSIEGEKEEIVNVEVGF